MRLAQSTPQEPTPHHTRDSRAARLSTHEGDDVLHVEAGGTLAIKLEQGIAHANSTILRRTPERINVVDNVGETAVACRCHHHANARKPCSCFAQLRGAHKDTKPTRNSHHAGARTLEHGREGTCAPLPGV